MVESDSERYFYVRVIENDGDWVVSSAVWVRGHLSGTAEDIAPAPLGRLSAQPNPCNDYTVVSYTLPGSGIATLLLYDLAGRPVATLARGRQSAGQHRLRVAIAGSRLARGVYFVRLVTNGATATRKLVVH
jgi:hypothetical protein